jgi:ankyrin repeat protein
VKITLERVILEDFPHPHSHLADVCITHLAACGFQRAEVDSTKVLVAALQSDPLLAYAHYEWAFHARRSMDVASFCERLATFVEGCQAFPVAIGDDQQFDVLGPLHLAAFFDLPLSLAGDKALLDPNVPTRYNGLTPLGLACREGSIGAVEELLRLPSTLVNKPDNDGCMPLHWASRNGCEGVIEQLLAHSDIDTSLANQAGHTPLTLASRNCRAGAIRLLLIHSQTDVNLPDSSGHTALTLASRSGSEDIVQLLLGHAGIDVNLKAVNGRSALFFASLYGHTNVVELFLKFPGIEVGSDMFLAASSEGHVEAAQLLEAALVGYSR